MTTPPTTPSAFELTLPAEWQALEFLSDLHLQASEPATLEAFANHLRQTSADALFILGDLFEVWVGDDAAEAEGFEAHCGALLREASRHRKIFFMPGNRDFLVGPAFLSNCHVQGLPDPTVFEFAGQRWLISHGDELCVDDVNYQQFRTQVRAPQWQTEFLARPLPERQAIGRAMRDASAAHQKEMTTFADVDAEAARRWLSETGATSLIHGHTHRPAVHALGIDTHHRALRRIVLSDWHVDAQGTRADVLRLDDNGLHRIKPLLGV